MRDGNSRKDVSAIIADAAVTFKGFGRFQWRVVEFVGELATVTFALVGFKFGGGHSWLFGLRMGRCGLMVCDGEFLSNRGFKYLHALVVPVIPILAGELRSYIIVVVVGARRFRFALHLEVLRESPPVQWRPQFSQPQRKRKARFIELTSNGWFPRVP